MTVQSESKTSAVDVIRLLLAVTLIVSGIVGFYYFADQSLLYRVLALVGVVIVCAFLVFTTELGRRTWAFMKESRVLLPNSVEKPRNLQK